MSLVVRAFPLRRPVSDLEAFASALSGDRATDAERFYRQYGIAHESWHVQHTDHGPWVIAVTALANPTEAGNRYADATEEFHVWFKEQVLELTGIDPNKTPLGPPTTKVFSWSSHPATQDNVAAAS